MKKYSNSDIKSLKRNEIIDLLKKEGVEFDETMPFFSLRKLLLDIEVEEEKSETEQPNLFNNSFPKEENEESISIEEQPKEEPKVVVENKQPKQNSAAARKSFNAELAKRMATFGKVHRNSPFELELARRKGKPQGSASFADELKARQIKARRF